MKFSNNVRRLTIVIIISLVLAFVAGLFLPRGSRSQASPSWELKYSDSQMGMFAVSAIDARTAWVTASETLETETILRTTDAGATWESHPLAVAGYLTAADANTAWLAENSNDTATIAKTTDGGKTWKTQFSYPNVGTGIMDMKAVDTNTVWAIGVYGPTAGMGGAEYTIVLKTNDGGATWSGKTLYSRIVPAGGPPDYLVWASTGISACDANVVWAAGYYYSSPLNADVSAHLWKTTDGGATWAEKPNPASAYIWGLMGHAICGVDANTVWLTDGTAVWRTTDGGDTWGNKFSIQPPQYSSFPPSIAAFGTDIAWIALVPSSRIIRALDGGANWSEQSLGTSEASTGLSAVDPNTAWATGVNPNAPSGDIFLTTDGGGQPVTFPPKVSAINPSSGVNTTTYALEVLGSGFQDGATVRLEQGTILIDGTGVAFSNSGRLTCYLDLNSKPLGKYDVVVKNPDGQEGLLSKGFSVTNICGQGAGSVVLGFGLMMGLLSLGGSGLLRRRRGRKSG